MTSWVTTSWIGHGRDQADDEARDDDGRREDHREGRQDRPAEQWADPRDEDDEAGDDADQRRERDTQQERRDRDDPAVDRADEEPAANEAAERHRDRQLELGQVAIRAPGRNRRIQPSNDTCPTASPTEMNTAVTRPATTTSELRISIDTPSASCAP